MKKLSYKGQDYPLDENETVLECLLRAQVDIAYSCRSGVCQSCLMQASEGDIPDIAQEGLKPAYKQRNLFLACKCHPLDNMSLKSLDQVGVDVKAKIISQEMLNQNIVKIELSLSEPFECEPGQYLTLINPAGVARSYSIANNLARDGKVELHIAFVEKGLMSHWLKSDAQLDDEVLIRGPAGNCFYVAQDDCTYPIILAGTGTGLAPLYAIAKEALANGHQGAVKLFHGALKEDDLYLVKELQTLDQQHDNFNYVACVLNGEDSHFYQSGNLQDIVMKTVEQEDIESTRLFLCGAPEMVGQLKTKAFLKGLASKHIYVDAFLPSKTGN